jgi:ribonuclease R
LQNPPKRHDVTPSQADLREISRHISDTERTSADAESETKQIKLLEYLDRVASSEKPPLFDGLITDVRPMGLMVEIPDMGVRGVVKREDLPEGRWRFEAHRMAWTSMDGKVIQLGMRIPLRVTRIDFDKRFVDFAVAGKPTSAGTHYGTPARPIAAKNPGKPRTQPAAKVGPSSRSRYHESNLKKSKPRKRK